MRLNDMRRLEGTENTMLRWMCGVTLRDRRLQNCWTVWDV